MREVITAPREEDRMRVEIAGDAMATGWCAVVVDKAYGIWGTWRRDDGACVVFWMGERISYLGLDK